MAKKDNNQVYQEAVDKLLAMFESGKMPEAVAFQIIRRQKGECYKPSDYWSLGNQILQMSQGTDDARGYKQWLEVGRHVRKGCHAIHIMAPLTKKVKAVNPKTGLEEDKVIVFGFRAIPVYRYEDTDGADLEGIPDYSPATPPPFWNVAEKLGISVRYVPMMGNYLGQFNMAANTIKLCSKDAVVYFHELAHAVHNTFTDLRTCDKAVAEAVAEFSAVVMASIQGIDGYEKQAWEYIKMVTDNRDNSEAALKALMQVLSDVEKVVSIVLSASDESHNEEKAPALEAV